MRYIFVLVTSLIIQPINIISKFLFSAAAQKESTPIPKGKKILLIGDSLAQGMAASFYKLVRQKGYVPHVDCKQGTRIDYWAKKLDKTLNATRPSLLIVSLGTNDSGLRDPEVQRTHVKNIKKIAARYNTDILWILPQTLPARFVGQDGIKKIIQEELGEKTFDTKIKLEKIKDQIHLTKRGYEAWITSTWDQLVSSGVVSN